MWCGCFVLISKLCSWVQSAFSAIRVQQSHDDRESTTLSCDGSLFIRLPTSFSVRWCFVRFTCTQVFGGSMEPLLVTAGTDYDFERLWVENILANVQGLNKVWCWICGTQFKAGSQYNANLLRPVTDGCISEGIYEIFYILQCHSPLQICSDQRLVWTSLYISLLHLLSKCLENHFTEQ